MKPSATIAILSHDDRWKGLRPTAQRAAEAVLYSFSSPHEGAAKDMAVSIVLSDDAEVQALNLNYRKKDKPTNVLSFPDGDVVEGVLQLGDIILAYDTVAGEAAAQNKPLKHHITHLVIHGVLHLLGHDHETEAEAEAMEAIEIKLLARMAIANPYESA